MSAVTDHLVCLSVILTASVSGRIHVAPAGSSLSSAYGFILVFHPIRNVISNNVSVISSPAWILGICESVPVSRPVGSAARVGERQECGGVRGYVQGLTSAEPP